MVSTIAGTVHKSLEDIRNDEVAQKGKSESRLSLHGADSLSHRHAAEAGLDVAQGRVARRAQCKKRR